MIPGLDEPKRLPLIAHYQCFLCTYGKQKGKEGEESWAVAPPVIHTK